MKPKRSRSAAPQPNRPASTAMTAAGMAKLPEPRVMWPELNQLFTAIPQVFHQGPMRYRKTFPVAVIPLTRPPSAAKLKAVQRLLEMDDVELIDTFWYKQGLMHRSEISELLGSLGLLPLSTARRGGRK